MSARRRQGPSRSLGLIFLNLGADDWQNDPLGGVNVDSAPAIAAQPAGPAKQLDLLYQGAGSSLWFVSGPAPSTDIAPTFTASRLGKAGTGYGG
jgi:hypothetical protein